MGYDSYHQYLQSVKWQELRLRALKKVDNRCQICYSPLSLNVHHRKYPEVWGTEPLKDLVVLCRECHKIFHERFPKPREISKIPRAKVITDDRTWFKSFHKKNTR